MISDSETAEKKLSKNEYLKADSHFLRGTILEGLADASSGRISDEDTQLTKFHGIYQQDDRDVRKERAQQKLERAYQFMVRVRVPGGVCTPAQWLEMDRLSGAYGNGTMKLTTRQAFQLHGILKRNLKTTIKEINDALMDTIAACGDVNRNVMCNPNPHQSQLHEDVHEVARAISDHLTPRTRAYHEIWLDGEKVASSGEEEEPIYGKTYLPRKFKTSIAIPPSNDVDIYAHCLGFIAIADEQGGLAGFNVTVGGGMGMTHNKPKTFPRLADVMGYCTAEQAVAVAEAVVKVQRDYGDRADRKHARFKYTVEDYGLPFIRSKVEEYAGFALEEPRPFVFEDNGDRYGWVLGHQGRWHLTLFIENGRIVDSGALRLRTGLREVAKVHQGDFRLTANQNLIIGNVAPADKERVEALLAEYGIMGNQGPSGLRRNAMACVALPTCGLSLAESERYLPKLIDRLEDITDAAGLRNDDITIRMTGCPNGCARPYIGEIGLVGKAPGKYNLYLGAGFHGERLNKLYKQAATEDEIVAALEPIIHQYARERQEGERFGDFVVRAAMVPQVTAGRHFHD